MLVPGLVLYKSRTKDQNSFGHDFHKPFIQVSQIRRLKSTDFL